MFCYRCGTQLPDGAKMCHNCRTVFDPNFHPQQQTNNLRYTPDPRSNQPNQFGMPQNRNNRAMNQGFARPQNNFTRPQPAQSQPSSNVGNIILWIVVILVVVGAYKFIRAVISQNERAYETEITETATPATEENITDEVVKYPETIPLETIYEDDNILINTTSYNHDEAGVDIGLYIENKSSRNLTYDNTYTGINNRTLIAVAYGDVTAGNKTNVKLHIPNKDLSFLNGEGIKRFDLRFSIWDSDDWSYDCNTDVITIKTSEYDDIFSPISGKELYADDCIRVLYDSKDYNSYRFVFENNSDERLTYTLSGITINGFTNSDIYIIGEFVFPHSSSVFEIELSDEFLNLNGIDVVNDVEFSVEYYLSQDYQRSKNTGLIKLDSFN